MDGTRLRLTVILIVLASALALVLPVSAEYVPVDQHVSHPSTIVSFQNYSTPQIEPGDSGHLEFKIVNRYDRYMSDVELEIEVFRAANEDESKNASKVKSPPRFSSEGYDSDGEGSTKITIRFSDIDPGIDNAKDIKLKISTKKDTYEATYLVRSKLVFWYGNSTDNMTKYVMKSKGHFSNEHWDRAASEPDPDMGNLNLNALNVSGIIPDTSFGVRSPFPQWPKYACGAGAVVFLGLGILFMSMENYGKFPKLNKWIQGIEERKYVPYSKVELEEVEDEDDGASSRAGKSRKPTRSASPDAGRKGKKKGRKKKR